MTSESGEPQLGAAGAGDGARLLELGLVICALLFAVDAPAALVKAGPEITLAPQAVVHDACTATSGQIITVQVDLPPNSTSVGELFVRRYSARGELLAPETAIGVSVLTSYGGRVACDPAGGFIVVWRQGANGIFARRYDAAGIPIGGVITAVLPEGTYTAIRPDIAIAQDSSFVVAWDDNSAVPGEVLPAFRWFDAAGTPLGPAVSVPVAYPPVVQTIKLSVEIGPTGRFLVLPGGFFDETGTLLVSLPLRNIASACFLPSGEFLIAEDGYPYAGGGGILLTRYDGNGAVVAGPTLVNEQEVGGDMRPVVGCSVTGESVVAWLTPDDSSSTGSEIDPLGLSGDGHYAGAHVRLYDAAGAPSTGEFPANSHRDFNQVPTAVTFTTDERLLIAYNSSRDADAQFFCDDADASCDYACPYYDDGIDPDGDGVPSGCDSCTNVGQTQAIDQSVRIAVKSNPYSFYPAHHRFVLKGSFALPPSVPDLASLAPDVQPFGVLVENQNREIIFDDAAPTVGWTGTAGWKLNSKGTAWVFKDSPNLSSAAYRAKLKTRGSQIPPRVAFLFKSRTRIYPNLPTDIPPHVVLTFGGQAGADAGRCVETDFTVDECDSKVSSTHRLRCKRP